MQKVKDFLKTDIYLILAYRVILLLIVYSICRIVFYEYNHSHFPGLKWKEIITIFTAGLLFDISSIVYINLLYFFLYLLPFKFRHNKKYQNVLMWLFFLTNALALISNIIDIAYFDFILERTTMDVFDEFKNEENMTNLFLKFMVDFWFLTLLWLSLIVLMILGYVRLKVGPPKIKSGFLYFIVATIMVAFSSVLIIGGARGGFKHFAQPITMSNAWSYVKKPENSAIVLNTPFTLMHSIQKRGFKRADYFTTESEIETIYTPIHRATYNPVRKENVVIIIIESLNKEFVGSLNKDLAGGSYKGYTPFLDSLIGMSKVFRHSYANGRKSIDILPSVFCSLPNFGIPFVLMTPYYRNKLNSLPGMLKEIGYKSAFFHGAPNGSFGFQSFTNIIGVDEYFGMNEYNNDADYDGSWGIWDEEFMQYFAENIDTFSTPFMASFFSITSHHPFVIPEKFRNKFPGDNIPQLQCIQYMDYSLKRFFETASKMPWYKNTLFIITADHVSVNQQPEFQNEIGYFSVPIIFYKPGSKLSCIDTITNAQQIDIMPTVLNYLGYNKDFISFGKDLFNKNEKNFAFNYLNNSYRLFLNDKLLMFNGTETNAFYKVENRNLTECIKDSCITDKLQMELFLKAYIQQYKNRMIDDHLSEK